MLNQTKLDDLIKRCLAELSGEPRQHHPQILGRYFREAAGARDERPALSLDVDEALALVDEILDAVEEVPEKGQEFAESVSEKTVAISDTIVKTRRVSGAQRQALENMLEGVRRWTREKEG